MDVATGGLKDYLVLLLDGFGEKCSLVFLSAWALVDDVSDGCIFSLRFWGPSGEHVESWSFVGRASDQWVSSSSFSVDVGVSVGISHGFTLVERNSNKPIGLFLTNNTLNSLIGDWVELDAMEGSIDDELFSFIELYIGVEQKIPSDFGFLLNCQFPIELVLF